MVHGATVNQLMEINMCTLMEINSTQCNSQTVNQLMEINGTRCNSQSIDGDKRYMV